MNAVDILLILGIVSALALAIRKCVSDRRKGKVCSGNCAACGRCESKK